jgi:hypothetical protein
MGRLVSPRLQSYVNQVRTRFGGNDWLGRVSSGLAIIGTVSVISLVGAFVPGLATAFFRVLLQPIPIPAILLLILILLSASRLLQFRPRKKVVPTSVAPERVEIGAWVITEDVAYHVYHQYRAGDPQFLADGPYCNKCRCKTEQSNSSSSWYNYSCLGHYCPKRTIILPDLPDRLSEMAIATVLGQWNRIKSSGKIPYLNPDCDLQPFKLSPAGKEGH